MNWNGRQVLVTGAGGFVGSHLCERLVDEGARVRAFVRYTSRATAGLLSLLEASKRAAIEVRYGDLGDPAAVRLATAGCSVVFHLGALVAIPYSYQNPDEVVRVNVSGTHNVLNAARNAAVDLVVHTSSSEVYGSAQYVPIDERHPLNAQSPYSASKIAADAIAHAYHLSFDLPVATIRPFNTYGPRQSGRAVIPTIVAQALSRDRIELGALDTTRDLTYVADTVDGFIRVGAHPAAIGRVTNVGNGTEIRIGELAARVCRLLGRDLPIVSTPERMRPPKSEVGRLCCDASWAREHLGWVPRTDFDSGLSQVIDFIRERPGWVDVASYQV